MKDANPSAATHNGLVVSSDEDALSSVLAGAWTGSKQMTVFEGLEGHNKAPKQGFESGSEMNCHLKIDLDKRSAEMTVNGVTSKILFSESMTSISYVGFAVKGAETSFSNSKLVENKFSLHFNICKMFKLNSLHYFFVYLVTFR